MKKHILNSILVLSVLALSACNGGSSSTPNVPPVDPVVAKKTINVDNLGDAFTTYLLYRYRLNKELQVVLDFLKFEVDSTSGIGQCPKQGSIQQVPPGIFGKVVFNACQSEAGTVLSGSINPSYFAGTAKTTSFAFTDLSYQLSDDTEYQKLTGSFSENRNFPRSIDFKLSYTNGTRTAQYAVDITKLNLVDIKTTAISGNQHFVLTDLNDKGEAITPILSAEDGSNLTLAFDNAGAATLSLRNDSGGKVITTKSYSKAEIDDLIVGARRAKK